MCRVLGLSTSGYYAWLLRTPSARAVANDALLARMREIHVFSRESYGAPRMYAELRDEGVLVNRKRVARLMKQDGLVGVTRRKKWRTTKRDPGARPAPDLVQRDFRATGPDQLWVADITYVPTASGFLYLAVVVDAWSRRVVGWSMQTHLKSDLVLKALDMALMQRRPEQVIHHSDQGYQGGFKRSSQRLTREVTRWPLGDDVRSEHSVPRCAPQVGRQRRGGSTGRSSGRRSPEAYPAKMRRGKPESHLLSERGGFGTVGGCHPPRFARYRAGTCRSPSARRLRCCGHKDSVSAQWLSA
jgi:putative transposase